MEENISRIVSAKMRPLVQRLETLEEKTLSESLSEKDGSTAMETKGNFSVCILLGTVFWLNLTIPP